MLIGVPLAFGPNRHATREWLLASGVRVAIILIVAWLVLRVGLVMTARIERELSRGEGLDVLERTKRAQTLGRLVHNVLAVLIGSIALLMVLRELGIDIVPMLTGAGIAGVALGFGAQWLVRDVIAGFFLILENQVRVGDVAAINGVGGVVEAINLRTIVLRDAEGAVHVFPNGAINTLANRTKDFSFYVIDVNVLYNQDVDRVIEVLRATGQEFEQDPGLPRSHPGTAGDLRCRCVSRHQAHGQDPHQDRAAEAVGCRTRAAPPDPARPRTESHPVDAAPTPLYVMKPDG